MEKPELVKKFFSMCSSKKNTSMDIANAFTYPELKEIGEWIEMEKRACSTEIVLRKIKEAYDNGVRNAQAMNLSDGQEGVERKFSEKFMENILFAAVKEVKETLRLNVELVRGTDDYFSRSLTTTSGKVLTDDKIQVDFNLYYNKKLIAVIEVKSNLDKCYLKRTVSDFEDIASSIKEHGGDPSKVKYVLFVGQNAIYEDTLDFFKTRFSDYGKKYGLGNIKFDAFFFINGKRHPSYGAQHTIYQKNPGINESTVRTFVPYLINTIKSEA